MSVSFEDVVNSISSWQLGGLVECKQKGSRIELTYKGVTKSFPGWLALQKVNQIGADLGYVEHEL